MNSNRPTADGFVVFADEEADNTTITGATLKDTEFSPAFALCSPDSSALGAGVGGVSVTRAKNFTQVADEGLKSTDLGMPQVTIKRKDRIVETSVRFSLVGLKASDTQNHAIGIGTVPAYAYQHLDAKNGKVIKTSLTCINVAAGGGTTDIDIVYAAAKTIDYGEAAGGAYGINAGAIGARGKASFDTAAVKATNAHYMYVVVGDTNGDDSPFTAGEYIYQTIGVL